MKTVAKILKWVCIILGVFILVVIVFLHNVDFSPSQKEIDHAFEQVPFEPEHHYYIHQDREMHYAAIGDTANPRALFVHGSPGSWDAFLWFMSQPQILDNYRVISVDRPGFGESGKGIPERSLSRQAEDIVQILTREHTNQPTVLLGHSYGGPVIAQIAVDHPSLVEGLVMIAPSIDPKLEKTYWYQVLVHNKALSWILPEMIYSTNEEILALKKELIKLEPKWQQIKIPVSVIQGEKDRLVPPENAGFAKEVLVNAPVRIILKEDLNHFVPWTHPRLIYREMEAVFEQLMPQK